ncbi:hypothetical protein GE09DRAFT_1261585 [Coniochaeta sp. 2T2.1]|nr:hypothetical protein GE09DRAFT_1261585 [Coniochaeta sp. 2T2.1]
MAHCPNPLYKGPAPLKVRHMIAPFNLRDNPKMFEDPAASPFLFSLFPGTVCLSVNGPFLCIGVQEALPPKPWPKTVAGLIPWFYCDSQEDANSLAIPFGIAAKSKRRIGGGLDGHATWEGDATDWEGICGAVQKDFREQSVAITEIIYLWGFVAIVLLNRDVDLTKLPYRVGRIGCRYLFEDELGRSAPPPARRMTDPAPGERPDNGNHATLQPGLRITSGYIPGGQQQYMSTTTGVLVKDRDGNEYMTAAAQGFPTACGHNVYRPVKLKAGEEFDNNITFEKNEDTPSTAAVPLGVFLTPAEDHQSPSRLRGADSLWLASSRDMGPIEGSYVTQSKRCVNPGATEQHWVQSIWAYVGGVDQENTYCGSAMMRARPDNDADVLDVVGFFEYAPAGGVLDGWCRGTSSVELVNRGFTLLT